MVVQAETVLFMSQILCKFTVNTYNCFDCNESNITETVTNTCDQYEMTVIVSGGMKKEKVFLQYLTEQVQICSL